MVEALQVKGFVLAEGDDIDLAVEMKSNEGMIPPDQFGFKKTKFTLEFKIYEPKQENRLLFSRTFSAQVASQSLFKSRELAIKQVKEQMQSNNIGQGLTNRILGEKQ